jgi:hypothetical protein
MELRNRNMEHKNNPLEIFLLEKWRAFSYKSLFLFIASQIQMPIMPPFVHSLL